MKNFITACAAIFCFQVAAQEIYLEVRPAGCGNATGWAFVETSLLGTLTHVWSPEPGGGQGTMNATGLAPGEYTITVSNNDGDSVSETFTVEALQNLYVTEPFVDQWFTCNTDCNGMTCYSFGVNGPFGLAPYTFDAPPGLTVDHNSACFTINGMCEGPGYQIMITDALGCSSILTIGPVELVNVPVLLSQNVVESCPGGANGSVELLFDQPVYLENDSNYYVPATLHVIEGIAPGTYQWSAWSEAFCVDALSFSFTIEELTTGCGTIEGTLYADLDADCQQQSGEPGIPYRTLAFSSVPEQLVITGPDGSFSWGLPLGEYTLDPAAPGFDPLCPPTLPIPFELDTDGQVIVQDIAMEPVHGADAYPHLVVGGAAPGFDIPHHINVNNDGPFTMEDLQVQFSFSPLQTLISSSITPDQNVPAFLSWDIPLLEPFTSWSVHFVLQLEADPLLIGDTITFVSTIVHTTPDADPTNDVHTLEVPIMGAYDPNDKQAFTSSAQSQEHYFPDTDEYIDYVVRFQNTGNAPAHNVFILDTISPLLDATSLQILGASHSFEVSWQHDRALRFDFPNIMLADSVNNEPESHGYISFRLRPVTTLAIGDLITNEADIFFDFNPPIRTNTTALLTSLPTSIESAALAPRLHVHPNPSSTTIRVGGIGLNGAIWHVVGVDGRELLSGNSQQNELVIDVSSLSRGAYILRTSAPDGAALQAKFIRE